MAFLTDEERHAAALARLGAGPARLRRFLDGVSPVEAWRAIASGEHPADRKRAFEHEASETLLESVEASCERAAARVLVLGGEGYPAGLEGDHKAPAVLFALGDPECADHSPRVTIVGTRSATPYGLGVASELGRGLAEAGVVVVSGLARGIDSAAHAGALAGGSAPVVGVLGTPPDARLPRSQDTLRAQVASRGTVLSELPPGSSGAPAWWFVIRNRVMAALAHVVVVVESHSRGGALHTVRAANDRGVCVAAVPGSVRSPASAGTNALLVDGATPVRHVDDVLTALELAVSGLSDIDAPRGRPACSTEGVGARTTRSLGSPERRVLRVLDQDPAPLDTVAGRCGMALGEVALFLERLYDAGLASSEAGWWSSTRR